MHIRDIPSVLSELVFTSRSFNLEVCKELPTSFFFFLFPDWPRNSERLPQRSVLYVSQPANRLQFCWVDIASVVEDVVADVDVFHQTKDHGSGDYTCIRVEDWSGGI